MKANQPLDEIIGCLKEMQKGIYYFGGAIDDLLEILESCSVVVNEDGSTNLLESIDARNARVARELKEAGFGW